MRLTIPQHQLTLSGNTAGALTNLSSGTVTLAGGNNITLSQAGNAVTISAPVSSSLSADGIITITPNGNTISIDASQSVQTQNMVAVTLSGNTSGAQALISSGTLTLAGGNNITVSQAGNAVTISGPNVGGAQTGISGIANSETTYTSGTVSLSELGAITIRSTTGNQFQLSVNAQSVQPETQTFIAGISASDTLYTSGNVRISGSQAATVRSGTGQLVIIDVPAQSTQVETQTFIAGVSASDTLYTSGNVRITGVGGGVTVSSNTGQRIDISVAAQSVQPETQTFIAGVSASDTLYTSGNVRITGVGGGITVSSNTGQRVDLSVAAPVAQTNQAGNVYASSNTFGTSSGTYDARSISIAGRGEISVAASNSGWIISAPVQSTQVETQTFIGGISASDTLYTSGSVRITGVGGGVTVSSNTGQRVDISVAAPVAQTNQAGSVYAISNTSGTSSGTYDARTLSIAGAGIVTVAASNSGWRINASQSVQTQQNIQALYDGANSISSGTVSLANANGVTFSVNAQTLSGSVNQSISMFAVSNTTQSTSGTAHKSALSFGGAGVASVGVTGGSVVISVPAGGGAGFSAGASNLGNTAGSTGITGTQLVFVGTNMVSLSQSTGANGGTLSINATQSVQTQGVPLMGVSTGGATSGDTTVNSGTRFVLVGTNITMSQGTAANATTVTVSAPATSSLSATGGVQISTNGSTISIGYKNTIGDWQNFPMGAGALMTLVAGISKTPFYFPVELNGYLTANSLAFKGSMVTANTLLSMSAHLGVYTLVNSTSAALLGSHSEAYVVSSATSVSLSGVRNFIMTGIGTHATLSSLSAGKYVFGMMFSAGASQSMNMSLYGASTAGGPLGGIFPGTNNVSAGTSQGVMGMYGRGSTTVNAMPANIVRSELVNQGSGASMQLNPWIYIRS